MRIRLQLGYFIFTKCCDENYFLAIFCQLVSRYCMNTFETDGQTTPKRTPLAPSWRRHNNHTHLIYTETVPNKFIRQYKFYTSDQHLIQNNAMKLYMYKPIPLLPCSRLPLSTEEIENGAGIFIHSQTNKKCVTCQ